MNNRLLLLFGVILLMTLGTFAASAQVTVTLPNPSVAPNTSLTIPVNVSSLTGLNVTSYEFIALCDTSFIRFDGIAVTGTLTNGGLIAANDSANGYGPGKMKVVWASASPLSGSGVLINLKATTKNKGGSTPIQLTALIFNDGTSPTFTLTNGSVTVSGANHRPIFTSIPSKTMKDGDTLRVTLSATDPDNDALTYGFVSVTPTPSVMPFVTGNLLKWGPAFADAARSYTIRVSVTDNITNRGGDAPGVDSTTVSVTVNRSRFRGDIGGKGYIQAVDASYVLRHVAGIALITGAADLWAADASGDGTISAFDASLILQAAAGLITLSSQPLQKDLGSPNWRR